MEFTKFFKLLSRHKYALIAVPILTAGIAFFFVRNMPNEYVSRTDISTGLVDASQQVMGENDQQSDKISQQFSNLLETIRLSKILNQVSYSLIIHDLTSKSPFKSEQALSEALSGIDKNEALTIFREKYQSRMPLDLTKAKEKQLDKLLAALSYDNESISKKLIVYRLENSDFIHVEYQSNNASQSAFVVNTLTSEFISYASVSFKQNREKANQFLGKLMQEKRDTMNSKIAALRNYKIANRILDLKELSGSLYTQITDYKDKKLQAEKDILSYKSGIKNINDRFNPSDRRYVESSTVKINGQISQTRERLKGLNDKYIQSSFDPKYKKSIDSLQDILSTQIEESSDKYIANPLSGKESLVQEKLKLELDLDMAQSSIKNLDKEIARLNSQVDRIVPFEASIQSFERDIEIATKEYADIQNKYNQSGIEANIDVKLKQLDVAMPGELVPSKKIVLVALAGIVSLIFYLVVLLAMFFMDKSVKGANELANAVNAPVLGYLNNISRSNVDYRRIGIDQQSTEELQTFKSLLRSTRYEIDSALQKDVNGGSGARGKVLAITSINVGEGKSLFALSLSSAYGLANKKVLLIDGNFDNPTISDSVKENKMFFENFLENDALTDVESVNNVSVLCNKGGDMSILEKSAERNIVEKINHLREKFDIIIIDTPALSMMNKSKEWIYFADKVTAVFEANQILVPSTHANIDYLKTLDSKFIGLVMNRVKQDELLEEGRK